MPKLQLLKSADPKIKSLSPESAAFTSIEDLLKEKWRRETFNCFPLDVFPSKMVPYLNELIHKMHIPADFVGSAALCAASAAIGSSYTACTNTFNEFLPIWICCVGKTSSGKSLAIDRVLQPFYKIDDELSIDNDRELKAIRLEKQMDDSGVSEDDYKEQKILYNKGTFQSFMQRTLKNNPKGIIVLKDEFTDLFREFNKKGFEEFESFLLTAWSSQRPYKFEKMGSRKQIIVPRTYACLLGGTQKSKLHEFFSNDRDSSGFAARFLYSIDRVEDILVADPDFEADKLALQNYDRIIRDLYFGLKVEPRNYGTSATEAFKAKIDRNATIMHHNWHMRHREIAKSLKETDIIQPDTYREGLGKMAQYAIRFSLILKLLHVASGADYSAGIDMVTSVDERYMDASLRISDYFLSNYIEASNNGRKRGLPADASLVLNMMRSGKSRNQISSLMKEYFQKGSWSSASLSRKIREWEVKYPNEFGVS